MTFKNILVLDHLKRVYYEPGSVNSDWSEQFWPRISGWITGTSTQWAFNWKTNLSKDQSENHKSRIIIIMIVSPLCGYMGDRYDRKFATLLSIFIWSASNFASTFCVSSQEIIITSKSYNLKNKYCNKIKEFFNVSIDKIDQWYWRSVYCLHCSNSFEWPVWPVNTRTHFINFYCSSIYWKSWTCSWSCHWLLGWSITILNRVQTYVLEVLSNLWKIFFSEN